MTVRVRFASAVLRIIWVNPLAPNDERAQVSAPDSVKIRARM